MSYFDDASLAFLPSGAAGKDGKAYSIKPTDGTGDFTFSRGSNLAATRVGADGLIEKGRENRFTQSNNFSTSPWTSSGTTETSGQSGYDGTSDAWLLNAASAGGYLYRGPSSSLSGVSTVSIYAKKGTADGVRLRLPASGSTDANVYINLIDGSDAKSATGVISHTVTSLGTGWYRIQMTFSVSSPINFRIFPANSSGSVVGGTIYIQDTQSEIGLAATEYIETTTTTGTAGILENTPRFDYSNGASCPSLLLEPSATQLFPQSEYFDGSDWTKYGGASLTNNNSVSPDGLQNATKLTNVGGVFDQIPYTPNTDYTYSLFAKTDGATSITIGFVDQAAGYLGGKIRYTFAANVASVILQSANGSVTADKEDYGNGWIRVIIKFKTNVAQNYNYQLIEFDGGDGWIYGANLIQSSYPTSYIPNHSGGTITRAADLATGAGTSSTFNDSEGVLFIELETTKNASPSQITINDGTYTNRLIFEVRPDAAFIKALINSGGSNVYEASVSATPNTSYKVAIKYSANDIAFFVNGVKEASTTTTTAMPTGLIDLSYTGRENDGALRFVGNIKQTLVFNTALSDADLATLTTI